jgi:hypothetical protein
MHFNYDANIAITGNDLTIEQFSRVVFDYAPVQVGKGAGRRPALDALANSPTHPTPCPLSLITLPFEHADHHRRGAHETARFEQCLAAVAHLVHSCAETPTADCGRRHLARIQFL